MSRDYNRNILDELMKQGTGDPEADIEENCLTYSDYGALFRDCLEYFGGSGNWDNEAFEFLHHMLSEVYNDLGEDYWGYED